MIYELTTRMKTLCSITSLVNDTRSGTECAKELHEGLLVAILTCESETLVWKEKEKSMIKAAQVVKFRVMTGVWRNR